MQLKKLQMSGFKTFADRTEIEFGDGLTAIVGPNGSGKSNIVDALLWVLGEQNPRMLRGDTAQDVIFAGSQKRKPLGMSEVKLTLDNADGTLPIQFTEVVITRRIYRSGDTQYLLNGAACRLKDITALFMDTGMGRGAYSVVGQNEMDSVLSAKPEDRRELFEEAAGIKKYRSKKREAMRKLESAETNLQRVRDILKELEDQREPLAKQAQLAKRYLEMQERLRQIEVDMLVSELKRADYELFASRQELEDDQKLLLEIEADLARLERISEDANIRAQDAEAQLEKARSEYQQTVSERDRLQNTKAVLQERAHAAHTGAEQAAEELKVLEEQEMRLQATLSNDLSDIEAQESSLAERRTAWQEARVLLAQKEQAYQSALKSVEALQGERVRRARAQAMREAQVTALLTRLESGREALAKLLAQKTELEAARADTEARISTISSEKESLLNARNDQLSEIDALKIRSAGIETALKQARTEMDSARRALAEQTARLAALVELHQNHEGFYQGVRNLLGAAARGQLSGHYAPVVDILRVPEKYRIAVEVALGGSLQDVVTRTESEARAGIEWLKQQRAGRATFLALPMLRPGQRLRCEPMDGVEGVAVDLVEFDTEYSPAALLLLGRTLITSELNASLAASRRLQGWSRIVTLEGEVLTPGGALTGGSLQGRGAHLVGRKGEIDDLEAILPKLQQKLHLKVEECDSLATTLQEYEQKRSALQQSLSTLSAELATVDGRLNSELREQSRLNRSFDETNESYSTLLKRHEATERERAESESTLLADAQLSADDESATEKLQEEVHTLAQERDSARAEVISLEVAVSQIQNEVHSLTRSIASDRASIKDIEHKRNIYLQRLSGMSSQSDTSETEITRIDVRLMELVSQIAKASELLETAQNQRRSILQANQEADAAARSATHRKGEVTSSLHTLELRVARLEIQAAQAAQRLLEEYGINQEDALAMPEDSAPDKQSAMEVTRLRRDIRAMGQVNTGATEEYDRLTERFQFLTEQQEDIENSRVGLLEAVQEIDASTRGVFMETFEAVKIAFQTLFTQLFNGGKTDLILTRPEDPLETGIDIIAQPPGKRAQNLSLLSGGERALTATALLFAFLTVRPSPFVLLDEVDAPLDGANVERFLRMVREFSTRCQFMVITHNPATMEAAPYWYGIAMKDPGVSSVLSYRVPASSIEGTTEEAVVMNRVESRQN